MMKLLLSCIFTCFISVKPAEGYFSENVEGVQSEITKIDLGGSDWTVTNSRKNITAKATVPGGIYTDLYNNGILTQGPLYYRFNDITYRWISKLDWSYSKAFSVPATLLSKERVVVVLYGVDTVSEVYINGQLVGETTNQFVRYDFDIKQFLNEGENTITLIIKSPVAYAKHQYDDYQDKNGYFVLPKSSPEVQHGENHVNHIRKMQSSFSWDWGPAFPNMGIWKDIHVEGFNVAVLRDTIAKAVKTKKGWSIILELYFDAAGTDRIEENTSLNFTVEGLGNHCLENFTLEPDSQKKAVMKTTIDYIQDIELWWPNGYGAQKLYNAVLVVKIGEDVSESAFQVGFRTAELVQEPIKGSEGLSFYFRINGVAIFAKGTNWIPGDALLERITPEYYTELLTSAQVAHMNMIRVWGGGIYEANEFYQIADELGIMVWQDFMFACAMYPVNGQFLENVEQEVIHQVRRLQHHPSIVLWAGNNENEAALRQNWYGTDINFEQYKDDFIKLYVDTIKTLVENEDLHTDYLVSSPTNGKESEEEGWIAEDPYSLLYGDVHVYNYFMDTWKASNYARPRFSSEYGYQSWPSFETLAEVTEEEDWSYFSEFMRNRQHHPLGSLQIINLVHNNLQVPNNIHTKEGLQSMLYLMQVEQAMAIKTETEVLRRSMSELFDNGEGHTMGALYWQLNDIWQGASWSSIEYGGKWKMLHYFAEDFFSPIIISPYEDDGKLVVYVVSDLLKETLLNSTLQIYSWDSFTPKYSKEVSMSQPAQTAQVIMKEKHIDTMLSKAGCRGRNACFIFTTVKDAGTGEILNNNVLFPTNLKKPLGLKKARVEAFVKDGPYSTPQSPYTYKLSICTDAIAPFTWIEAWATKGYFSDNGFMFLDQVRELEFYSKADVKQDDLQDSLKITSLLDAYTEPEPTECWLAAWTNP